MSKKLKKKKQIVLLKRNFDYDASSINLYSLDKLKDLIYKYDTMTNKNESLFEEFTKNYFTLLEELETAEEKSKELENEIQGLQGQLMKDSFVDEFFSQFKERIGLVLSDSGLDKLKGISESFDSVNKGITELQDKLSTVNNKEPDTDKDKENMLADGDKANTTDIYTKLSQEIANNQKSIVEELDKIKGVSNVIQNKLEGIFYKTAAKHEFNMMKKYKLDDLLLISKTKLNTSVKAVSAVKKENSKLVSENKAIMKSREKLQSENAELIIEFNKIDEKLRESEFKLQEGIKRNETIETEQEGHMNLIRLLQNDNYRMSKELQEKTLIKDTNEKDIARLKEEMDILQNKLNETMTKHETDLKAEADKFKESLTKNDEKHIHDLRIEKLKLEQTKRDLNALEEKQRKYECILKAENIKYEQLYRKFKHLKNSSKKNSEMLTKSISPVKTNRSNTRSQSFINLQLNEISSHRPTKKSHFLNLTRKDGMERSSPIYEQLEELQLEKIGLEVQLAAERNVFQLILDDKDRMVAELRDVS